MMFRGKMGSELLIQTFTCCRVFVLMPVFLSIPLFPSGVRGDSLTVLQAPEFLSFQKGDWPLSGEKIPDLVALTMGFSVEEVSHISPRHTCPCCASFSERTFFCAGSVLAGPPGWSAVPATPG